MKISKDEFTQRLRANLTIFFEEVVVDRKTNGDTIIPECTIVAKIPYMDIQEMVQTMFDNGFEFEYATELMLSSAVDEIGSTIDFNLGHWQTS